MKFRHWLFFVGLIGLAFVVIVNAGQLTNFLRLLGGLRWYVVVLIILIQLFSYFTTAKYYQSFFSIFQHFVGVRQLFEAALAVNFVNYIVPTAGLAGTGYLTQAVQPNVPRGEAFLAQLTRQGFTALGTLLILPAGFILLFLGTDVGRVMVRLVLLLSLLILAIAIAIVVLIDHEQLTRRLARWLGRGLSRFWKRLQPVAIERVLDEFYTSYHDLMKNWRQLLVPLGWAVGYILVEVFTLYLAFLAFGRWVNPGVVIVAYTLANIASLVGGAVFSVGVFEASMVGTLVALGSPFALAFSVTVVYRVLNMVIGLPPGIYYYRKYLPA